MALLGIALADPAGATLASFNTTAVCNTTVDSGICIAEVGAAYSASRVSLDMHVGQATDPNADPNWQTGNTTIGWSIFVNGESSPSYVAVLLMDTTAFPAVLTGAVTTADGTSVLCFGAPDVAVTFNTTTNAYGMGFPASCLGSPATFSIRGTWAYFTGTVEDFANTPSAAEPPCCTVSPDQTATAVAPTSTDPTTSPSGTSRTTNGSTSTSTSTSTTVPCTTRVTAPTQTNSASPATIESAGGDGHVLTSASRSTSPHAATLCPTTTTTLPGIGRATTPPGNGNTTRPSGTTSHSYSLAVTGDGAFARYFVLLGIALVTLGSLGRVWMLKRRAESPKG